MEHQLLRLHRHGPSRRRVAPEPLWREALGRQLRRERTARGQRIVDVAERAGVSPQYLSELERGRKDPSSEVLSAVAGSLGMTVLDLTRRATTQLASTGAGSSGSSASCALRLAA